MPKVFTRLCHNPLHYSWTGDTTEKNIISLRANGLGKVINVFRAIEVERGERRKNITNCCSLCLTYCCEKGILKRKFMKKITPQLIVKVSKFFYLYFYLYFLYFENFFHSILRCWVMLVIFNRRHYNKALIILLTSFYHLQVTGHPLYHVLSNHLNAFDEYPVENFHSILRSKTKSTDTGEQIFRKAREIDACKNDLQEFQSWFVSKRKHAFCPKKIKSLKLQAAKFLISKFERIGDNPGQAKMIRRTRGQKKTLTKWMLPNIFGNEIVNNEVLLLAYNDPQTMPSNEK